MSATLRLAQSILTLSKRSWIGSSKQTAGLTETEFLTLDYLVEHDTSTVKQLVGHVRVLPAQMSRIIRRLQAEALIKSAINPEDKRKVDVTITRTGRQKHAKYRDAKLTPIVLALERLNAKERRQFMNLVDKMAAQPGAAVGKNSK